MRRIWDVKEWQALFDLYERFQGHPPTQALHEFRTTLIAQAPSEFRDNPGYRTLGSIRQQLSWVRAIVDRQPSAAGSPSAAWSAFRRGPVDWTTGEPGAGKSIPRHLGGGYARDREAIVRALGVLEETLHELVTSGKYLPDNLRPAYRRAWDDIGERGYLPLAIDALGGSAVDDLLAANGLIGPQREVKTKSIDSAVEERKRKPGWKPLKALLGYLDSLLGSLVKVITWLEPVKEFKESTEKSVELAIETVPD